MKSSNYFNKIDSFHSDCRIWFSELNFWEDELEFMRNLISKYSFSLIDRDKSLLLRELISEINGSLKNDIQRLKNRIHFLELNLAKTNNGRPNLDEAVIQKEIKSLQCDMSLLGLSFQNIKKDFNDLMKGVIKESEGEKLQELAA